MSPFRAMFIAVACAALASLGCGGSSSATATAAPTAAFTVSSSAPAVNKTVVFTDGSSGAPTNRS